MANVSTKTQTPLLQYQFRDAMYLILGKGCLKCVGADMKTGLRQAPVEDTTHTHHFSHSVSYKTPPPMCAEGVALWFVLWLPGLISTLGNAHDQQPGP